MAKSGSASCNEHASLSCAPDLSRQPRSTKREVSFEVHSLPGLAHYFSLQRLQYTSIGSQHPLYSIGPFLIWTEFPFFSKSVCDYCLSEH